MVENKLYGYVIIDLENKMIYTQWSEDPNTDWSRGEDLVFSLEDTEEIRETLKNSYVMDVEVSNNRIKLWLVTNV
jgi:hypothetical protein